ncbi:MAG: Hsp20/alpha crystallin family protein [Candidatus Wildermuthbacteria bacterium]|nr:Hsp20/alpha crystallin family protein [Candidatus Wildermuthbacteria bacterium]
MSSFFEKLKKGMGIEAPTAEEERRGKEKEEEIEEETKRATERIAKKSSKKNRLTIKPAKPEKESTIKITKTAEEGVKQILPKELKIITSGAEEVKEGRFFSPSAKAEEQKETIEASEPLRMEKNIEPVEKTETAKKENEEKWSLEESAGQLAVDVCQTETELIIQSAIAGIKPENMDISLERDILTIRGIRRKTFEANGDYFTKECYWGPFSREIILPVEVDPDKTEASMKEGILTIRIPKILREKRREITVRG